MVRDPDTMPDLGAMNLERVKAIAMSVGAYGSAIRSRLADACLARLRELGAGQVADRFADAWGVADLSAPSDAEAEEAATPRADAGASEEERAKVALRSASANAWKRPSAAKRRADRDPAAPPPVTMPATLPAASSEAAAKQQMRDASAKAYLRPSRARNHKP